MKKIHKTELKVRYAETDNMGIVYYANYLVWFEVGRTEYLLAEGLDYRDVEKGGLFMAVVEAHCEYRAPARYGESVIVETRPADVKNSSLRFTYRVLRKDDQKLLCEGYTAHVLIDKQMKPRKIPEHIRKLLV
jgi:acyl-CoA thioester hydrolase